MPSRTLNWREVVKDYRVPVENPCPDAARFIACMLGKEKCAKPPMVEYLVDVLLMEPITTELLGRRWADPQQGDEESLVAYLDNMIEFWYRMGYDHVRFEMALPFKEHHLHTQDTAVGATGDRQWADEHTGAIMTWEDFEKYEWPSMDDADFFAYEYIDSHLPAGMGLMTAHAGGIAEHLTWIMSYEGLCFALIDAPDLVEAVAAKLGTLMQSYYERLLELKNLIALFPGDDMGFKTATMINPDDLRKHALPWHRRFAEMAHARGLPYFLHSCGNVLSIMEDLIEDVRIDGKHSYEDVIIPAPEFHERYGDRIACLGGIDVDKLASMEPDELRKHVRGVIDSCHPKGRFAIGSGNSIPSYIPIENYLTMLDEALR